MIIKKEEKNLCTIRESSLISEFKKIVCQYLFTFVKWKKRYLYLYMYKISEKEPWLVWLSGLSTSLRIKGLPVPFPVRAHAWDAGEATTYWCFSPSLSPSLPLCLKVNKILKYMYVYIYRYIYIYIYTYLWKNILEINDKCCLGEVNWVSGDQK